MVCLALHPGTRGVHASDTSDLGTTTDDCFVRSTVVGPAVTLHGERTAELGRLRRSSNAVGKSSYQITAIAGYFRCPRIAPDVAAKTKVGRGLIVLKNSKNWKARNFGERAVDRQSPPSIWMAVAEALSDGQSWILADPLTENSCRVCADYFLTQFWVISEFFNTIGSRQSFSRFDQATVLLRFAAVPARNSDFGR